MTETEIQYFMREAILEGRKAITIAPPNPPVGCVIVSDNKIVARGHTNAPGKHHAEAMALDKIKNLDYKALTLFVTLEPCSFQGKTPSCASAIIKNKAIKCVYIGIIDPHPKNRGRGVEMLAEANIKVETGILKKEIEEELSEFLIR